MRFHLLLLTAYAWLTVSSACLAQEYLAIPSIEKVDVDGIDDEWHRFEPYIFNASDASIFQAAGDFDIEDLQVSVKVAWNKAALYFFITWEDDIIDDKVIAKDKATFTTNTGRRMDRMYLYDNIKIQLRTNSMNYVSWFGAHQEALQWHSLRERKEGQSTTIEVSPPNYHRLSYDTGKFSLEVAIPWRDFLLSATRPAAVDLLLLINDRDTPQQDIDQKLADTPTYITLSRKATFQDL